VIDERLPDTEVTQYGGMLKMNYAINDDSQFIAGYMHTQQDDGKRYDQLLGGDGNLIADLRDLSLDLFYLKYDRANLGWFDHATLTYSFNTQREERVNQGGMEIRQLPSITSRSGQMRTASSCSFPGYSEESTIYSWVGNLFMSVSMRIPSARILLHM
jgi:hypothetical protein